MAGGSYRRLDLRMHWKRLWFCEGLSGHLIHCIQTVACGDESLFPASRLPCSFPCNQCSCGHVGTTRVTRPQILGGPALRSLELRIYAFSCIVVQHYEVYQFSLFVGASMTFKSFSSSGSASFHAGLVTLFLFSNMASENLGIGTCKSLNC